jgi:hypothetical protein
MNTINWKLIFQLSLFGLVMALATVFWIPFKIEPVFWLIIFIICAFIIAKKVSSKYFLHGFLVSIVNCIWITTVHAFFFKTYMANHTEMVQMSANMPMHEHPRRAMILFGPFFGIVFGIILGSFSWIASKIVKK